MKDLTTDTTNMKQTEKSSPFTIEANLQPPNCSNQTDFFNLTWSWEVYTINSLLDSHPIKPNVTIEVTSYTSQKLLLPPNILDVGTYEVAVLVKQNGYYGTPSVAGGLFKVVPSQEISGYFRLTKMFFSLLLFDKTSRKYLDLKSSVENTVSNISYSFCFYLSNHFFWPP